MSPDDSSRARHRDPQPNRKGGPGYHDPTAGIGGAAPARSALTLRLALAAFGLLSCAGLAIWLSTTGGPIVLIILVTILGVIAAIDLGVVVRRKRRGEPG